MYHYEVLSNEKLTPTTRVLTLQCQNDSNPLLHQPGQYAAISLRDKLRPTAMRCFSITTSPTNQKIMQFSMRVKGRYTNAIERLSKGDQVFLRGPFGGFVFDQNIHKDAVFFAGGIGITPFMSMVRYATDLKLDNSIHLVYSLRDESDIPFFEELVKLESLNPNLKITFVLSGGNLSRLKGQSAVIGKADSSLFAQLGFKYAEQTFFVCGPPPYMKSLTHLLKEQGVPDHKIMSEAFGQGSLRQTGKLISWPFNMYALAGISLLVGGFFITANDLYKTLPKLQATKPSTSNSVEANTLPNSDVNSLKPQVDTNTSQPASNKSNQPNRSNNTTTTTTTTNTSNSSNSSSYSAPKINPTPTTTTPSTPTTAVS